MITVHGINSNFTVCKTVIIKLKIDKQKLSILLVLGLSRNILGILKLWGKKKLKDGILTGVIKLKLYLLKAYMVSNRPLYCQI